MLEFWPSYKTMFALLSDGLHWTDIRAGIWSLEVNVTTNLHKSIDELGA
jgi:hypothetical protein